MLEDLNEESKSEGQKEAITDCEHRPMASAAMLAHFKEPSTLIEATRLNRDENNNENLYFSTEK